MNEGKYAGVGFECGMCVCMRLWYKCMGCRFGACMCKVWLWSVEVEICGCQV